MGCCPCFQSDDRQDIVEPFQNMVTSSSSSPQKMREDAMSAQEWKQLGNNQFKTKNYPEAIKSYSHALSMPDPDISYFSNLALAYKANQQYQESIDTINKMSENPKFKAFQYAQLFHKGQVIKARCLTITAKQYCLAGKYSQRNNKLHISSLDTAIQLLQDILSVPNTMSDHKKFLETALKVKQFIVQVIVPKSKSEDMAVYFENKLKRQSPYQKENKFNKLFKAFYQTPLQVLQEIEEMVESEKLTALQQDQQFITDPITYEIFKEPVIVPSGQSYDKQILREHFKNNGYNDPITHEVYKLGDQVVVRNNNLQNYIFEMRSQITKDDLIYLTY